MKKELKALENMYWYIVANGAKEDYEKYYNLLKDYIQKLKKVENYCENRIKELKIELDVPNNYNEYDQLGLVREEKAKIDALQEILDLMNEES